MLFPSLVRVYCRFRPGFKDRERNPSGLRGVRVARTVEDNSPLQRMYRPGHPDADEEGYVTMPNVNPVEEMVNMAAVAVVDAQEKEKRLKQQSEKK